MSNDAGAAIETKIIEAPSKGNYDSGLEAHEIHEMDEDPG